MAETWFDGDLDDDGEVKFNKDTMDHCFECGELYYDDNLSIVDHHDEITDDVSEVKLCPSCKYDHDAQERFEDGLSLMFPNAETDEDLDQELEDYCPEFND